MYTRMCVCIYIYRCFMCICIYRNIYVSISHILVVLVFGSAVPFMYGIIFRLYHNHIVLKPKKRVFTFIGT